MQKGVPFKEETVTNMWCYFELEYWSSEEGTQRCLSWADYIQIGSFIRCVLNLTACHTHRIRRMKFIFSPCSFLFFHLSQHQDQKRQSEVHGVSRGWTGPWHWGMPTWHWGVPTRHFISTFISEPFLWVNEDVSFQPQPHYVKELLIACSISLTFMVILKPKWWTITLHSLQIKAGC